MATTAGLLLMALLPIAAAASLDAATPTTAPVALSQPFTTPFLSAMRDHRVLSDSALLVLAGSGLLALAGIVRRTTKV